MAKETSRCGIKRLHGTSEVCKTYPYRPVSLILPIGKNFMNATWLFAEAYKYRRLHECFSISKYWKVTFLTFHVRKLLKSYRQLRTTTFFSVKNVIHFLALLKLSSNSRRVLLSLFRYLILLKRTESDSV